MKKLFFFIIFIILSKSDFSQIMEADSIPMNQVPKKVLKSFDSLYNKKMGDKWHKITLLSYEAIINRDDSEYRILFDHKGNRISEKQKVNAKEIPEYIIEILREEFINYSIKDVYIEDIFDHNKKYSIELISNNKEIVFKMEYPNWPWYNK